MLMCSRHITQSCTSLHISLIPWFVAQGLVELEVEMMRLVNPTPCALAAHIPPNLTMLQLEYRPGALCGGRDDDEWLVCHQAHHASPVHATNMLPCACYCMCVYMMHGVRTADHGALNMSTQLASATNKMHCVLRAQNDVGRRSSWNQFMTAMLQSLPLLQAPLRYLCLQRCCKTPFTGAVTGTQ